MDNLSTLNEKSIDAARAGLLRLHDAVVRREPSRPEAALSPEELLARFRAADPTRNAACLPWLLRTYAAGGYRLEDLSKAHDTLAAFARLRGQLPNTATIDGEMRNPRKLGSHVTLASLWKAVAPLVEAERLTQEDNAGEQNDTDKERALSQSRVIHRSNRMVIAVPMTEEASCWWGQGTQWCTAARNDNAFEEYHKKAPLIVICLRKVGDLPARKLQLHVHAGGMQFMDENDAPVLLELISERWKDLEALLYWSVDRYGQGLEYIPELLRTEAICLAAVGKDGDALDCVPNHLCTEAICTVAVSSNGLALAHVPEPLRTKEICTVAVASNGEALYYVPNHLCTEAIFLTAVSKDGRALEYVPEPLRTEEMCLDAVEQDGLALYYVPEHLRTEAMYLIAVTENGNALDYVPDSLRTEAMCSAAVVQNGNTLYSVPNHMRTEAICSAAVAQNGWSLCSVPESLRTEAICTNAVTEHGEVLEYVPPPLRTEAMCLTAVGGGGLALIYVPKHLCTEAMCLAAVVRNGMVLHYIPEHLRTEAICLAAVGRDEYALRYVPEHLRAEIKQLATEARNKQKSVSKNSETNKYKTHDLILEELEDCLNNLQPGHQNTVSSIKSGI